MIPTVSITKLTIDLSISDYYFFLVFLTLVFGYLFKFLSLRERLSFDFRCKSTTSNSQNLGVKSKKYKKNAFFFIFGQNRRKTRQK